MKTRYRILARRRLEAPRRLRLRSAQHQGLEPIPDDPMELPTELVDVATGERIDPPVKGSTS
ncbi:MAG: hypothetical protein JKY56_22950 [Kofleriaceae bacterium]|nr:hypothetical protein [Kofleriaceae bacterium]